MVLLDLLWDKAVLCPLPFCVQWSRLPSVFLIYLSLLFDQTTAEAKSHQLWLWPAAFILSTAYFAPYYHFYKKLNCWKSLSERLPDCFGHTVLAQRTKHAESEIRWTLDRRFWFKIPQIHIKLSNLIGRRNRTLSCCITTCTTVAHGTAIKVIEQAQNPR